VIETLPGGWRRALGSRIKAVDLAAIDQIVAEARPKHDVYPQDEQVFAAFGASSQSRSQSSEDRSWRCDSIRPDKLIGLAK